MTRSRNRFPINHLMMSVLATGLLGAAVLIAALEPAAADTTITRPTRIPRPTRPPRRPGPHDTPPPEPTATPTATQAKPSPGQAGTPTATSTMVPTPGGPQECPGVPVTCPARPACKTGNKLGQLYYKHPTSSPIITTRPSEIRLNPASNGIYPDREVGSFSLTDKDNVTVVQLTDLVFQSTGSGWLAQNEHGWVSIWPTGTGAGYNYQVQINDPNFPPGYFSVVYQVCLSIGDDGVDEQIVCQPKSRDGFLCHNNGPTYDR